jgi:hypothetical protein
MPIAGIPFVMTINANLILKPGFGGKNETMKGSFHIDYNGDEGITVKAGQAGARPGTLSTVSSFRKSFSSSSRSKPGAPDADRFAFPVEKCTDFPAEQAATQRAAQAAAKVPLVPGLILDSVLAIQNKDVESLSQFAAEDSSTLTFTYSGSGFHRRKNEVIVDQAFHTNPFTFCRSEIPASECTSDACTTSIPPYLSRETTTRFRRTHSSS